MIRMVHRDNRSEHGEILEQQFRLRHHARPRPPFGHCDGFSNDLGTDPYDDDHAIYMIAVDAQETVTGSYRLYPTLLPTMLSERYAHLIDAAPPRRSDVYEISRFVLRPSPKPAPAYHALSASLFEFGLENGLSAAISIVPARRLPLICAGGYRVHPLGLPQQIDGRSYLAIMLEFDERALSHTRRLGAITASVFDGSDCLQRPLP